MTFIGLDIGSSSLKAGVLDLDQGIVTDVRSAPFPNPVSAPSALWFEIDLEAVVEGVRKLFEQFLSAGNRCDGIVTCSQMGGVVLTNSAGIAVGPYLSWRDQRALEPHASGRGSCFDELQRRTPPPDFDAIGRELKPGSGVSLLFWMVENQKLPPDAVHAMSLGDYVLSRLCAVPPVTEPTLALGLVNLATGQWHSDWFARLGFGKLRWPDLVPFHHPAGNFAAAGKSIPCYPAVGDHQAALLGAEIAPEELSINASTGSQVSLLSSKWQPGNYQTRVYFEGRFLNTITHLPAGRSLNALVDLLTELPRAEGLTVKDPWKAISQAVERTAQSELDVNLAFFAGSMGDHGHVTNIRLEELNVGNLFRAAFRHMADNYIRCAERLSPDRRWNRVVLSGGLPQRLPALRDAIVDRFRSPFRMVDTPEETLQGLLHLARKICDH